MGDFAACQPFVLQEEGGFVNNPKDPGGATFQGVTQDVFWVWLRQQGLPLLSVRLMTPFQRDQIYQVQYWEHCFAGLCPPGIDQQVYDIAVNSGIARSVMELQQALGVAADGHFGLLSKAALAKVQTQAQRDALIRALGAERISFWKAIRHGQLWAYFGKGWGAREARCLALSLEMSANAGAIPQGAQSA